MGESVEGICRKCGNEVKDGGVTGEGSGDQPVICRACLETIYPEGMGLPVTMDKDGNLYFADKARNTMVIFFSYGDTPYSSCTEVSLEEEEWGCGFSLC
jgi:hypothetical protein